MIVKWNILRNCERLAHLDIDFVHENSPVTPAVTSLSENTNSEKKLIMSVAKKLV